MIRLLRKTLADGATDNLLIGFAVMVYIVSILHLSAFAQESPESVKILTVKEIKEEKEGPATISLSKVEEARLVTPQRIYGLIGLWAVIFLAIFLLRFQVKDDEKLYREGYYTKDVE